MTVTTGLTARPDGRRFLGLFASVVAVDLISKTIAVVFLTDPIDLRLLQLRVSHNSGVAFGAGSQLPSGLVLGLTGLATIGLTIAALRGHIGSSLAPAIIAGGATANVIDRVHNQSVVDFIAVGWWPTFNLADTSIVIGITYLLLGHRSSGTDQSQQAAHPQVDRRERI